MDFIVILEEGRGGKDGEEAMARIGIDHVDQGRPQSQFRCGFFRQNLIVIITVLYTK